MVREACEAMLKAFGNCGSQAQQEAADSQSARRKTASGAGAVP